MTESMWSFLRRNYLLIVPLLAIPSTFSYRWPRAPLWLSLLWSTLLPAALITWIGHREANRAKARHDVTLDAVSERLCRGWLTEQERELALTFYEELRHKLHDGAIRRGSFKPGESLHLLLCGGGPEELRVILPKLHTAPCDVPELTSDQELLLARLAATDPQCARLVVQWLFLSGGESAMEKLQSDSVFKPTEEEISEYVLGILNLLPDLPAGKFSQTVGYLKWRKKHLKGKMAVLPKLQDRLLECDDKDFEDTVAVIGGINCGRGQAALNECHGEVHHKWKRDCIDGEIALMTAPLEC